MSEWQKLKGGMKLWYSERNGREGESVILGKGFHCDRVNGGP